MGAYRVPMGILGRLGGLWGRLGPKKVAKMAPSGLPKRSQNSSWGVLGASWERLGGIMWPI